MRQCVSVLYSILDSWPIHLKKVKLKLHFYLFVWVKLLVWHSCFGNLYGKTDHKGFACSDLSEKSKRKSYTCKVIKKKKVRQWLLHYYIHFCFSYHGNKLFLSRTYSRNSFLKGSSVFVTPKFSPVEAKMVVRIWTVSMTMFVLVFIH